MEKFSGVIPDAMQNKQEFRPAPSLLPEHIREWLRLMNQKFPSDEGVPWTRHDTLAYGEIIKDMTEPQLDRLFVRLLQETDFRPSPLKVKTLRDRLYPHLEALPGYAREAQRPVETVRVSPESDLRALSEYQPTVGLLPPSPAETGRERFKRMQEECAKRGMPFNLAGALDSVLKCGVMDREVIRKRLLREAQRQLGDHAAPIAYAEIAWDLFCEERENNAKRMVDAESLPA